VFDNRVKERACLLRVAVGEEFHRTLKVGEEDGDVLAFALQCRPRVDDLFGEVLWGIAVRRT
jgi:hypothetical protein